MKKGFTIVELMTVGGILAVLLSIVVVAAGGAMKNAREKRATAMASSLQQGINAFYAQEGKWPQAIESRIRSLSDNDGDVVHFRAKEVDEILREVVGKGFGKSGGMRSMLVDASALFVARASDLKNGGNGCNDNHADKTKNDFCGNQRCVRGVDFSEAVKRGSKQHILFDQMAFGYQGRENGRFRRFWVSYNVKTDSVSVSK